jgi:DNA-binding GntR family transcriptional regulator
MAGTAEKPTAKDGRRSTDPAARTLAATGSRPPSPYEQLKRDIATGELGPGFPLVEGTLAESFGVSRTPIREALTRLEQDGLVMRTDRGLVVRERSPEEILDIYEVRILLAGLGARLAAQRRSALDLIRLRTRLGALTQADTADIAVIVQANRAFHRSVWKASHNAPVEEIMDRLNHQISARYPATTLVLPGRLEKTIAEHGELVAAIDAQDAILASSIATRHFQATRDARLQMWTQSYSGFEDSGFEEHSDY